MTSAFQTSNRDRAEVELKRFVPILLFRRAECESVATLNAFTLFVDVKVLRHVVPRAVDLLANISGNRSSRQRWSVIWIILPPLINLAIWIDGRVMDKRNLSEKTVLDKSVR